MNPKLIFLKRSTKLISFYLNSERKKRGLITKIRNEIEDIATDMTELKMTTRAYGSSGEKRRKQGEGWLREDLPQLLLLLPLPSLCFWCGKGGVNPDLQLQWSLCKKVSDGKAKADINKLNIGGSI